MRMPARVLLLAPVLAVGVFAAGAGPASAAAQSPTANCVGAAASNGNQVGHGYGGGTISATAHEEGGVGAFASGNCGSK